MLVLARSVDQQLEVPRRRSLKSPPTDAVSYYYCRRRSSSGWELDKDCWQLSVSGCSCKNRRKRSRLTPLETCLITLRLSHPSTRITAASLFSSSTTTLPLRLRRLFSLLFLFSLYFFVTSSSKNSADTRRVVLQASKQRLFVFPYRPSLLRLALQLI